MMFSHARSRHRAPVAMSALPSRFEGLDSTLAIIDFGLDGTILAANDKFLLMFGYTTQEELFGQNHRLFVDGQTGQSEEYRQFWLNLKAGNVAVQEHRRLGKNGHELWVMEGYSPLLDDQQRLHGVSVCAMDITHIKRKHFHETRQMAAVLEIHAVVEFKQDGTILSANSRFLDLMGYKRDEVVGLHQNMLVPEDDASKSISKALWSALEVGQFQIGEFRYLGKNGRSVWMQASFSPIMGADGKVFKVIQFAVDITTQVEQRHLMELLSLVADNTNNSVLIVDAKARVEYVNRGFERLSGYTRDEAIGCNPRELLYGPLTDKASENRIRDAVKKGKPIFEEILNYRKTGEPYWISLMLNPIKDAKGQVERFVSIQTDITDTKQKLLEAKILIKAIGAFNAIAEWSADGDLTYANDALKEWRAINHGYDVRLDAILSCSERQSIGNGQSVRREIVWPRVDSGSVTLEAIFAPLRDVYGKASRILMCAYNVSDRRIATDETVRAMNNLRQSLDQISKIVSDVEGIAEMTNVLSFNASIEAARAGEAGRGFAAVSEEVRALSRKSAEAAHDIRALLQENRRRMAKLSTSVERLDHNPA